MNFKMRFGNPEKKEEVSSLSIHYPSGESTHQWYRKPGFSFLLFLMWFVPIFPISLESVLVSKLQGTQKEVVQELKSFLLTIFFFVYHILLCITLAAA